MKHMRYSNSFQYHYDLGDHRVSVKQLANVMDQKGERINARPRINFSERGNVRRSIICLAIYVAHSFIIKYNRHNFITFGIYTLVAMYETHVSFQTDLKRGGNR